MVSMSLNKTIRKLRLEKAKEMLEISGLTLTEISYEVGINPGFYFSKCFREMFGVNPGEYK